ncbi:MAG: lysophospholipid acyltransferase family protein [Inhella sp.]|jgi:1-acyl-sn-glycerol-3-phosphate acyltransferase|uniref:lysophospholipid acyltransferase family protein n=1 Tax=Inhella sp. TaxID=1921806 RepID=UPI0022BC3CC0|nr:lysophospholipid acyltransferase family protein [Inhella sp.]MCZ8235559.1 lysophospholipid acyltransferase family protein [Inhella sp.]
MARLQRTIFTTPVVNALLGAFSRLYLRLAGWRVEGALGADKCVLIAAPHTSNWDLPLTLMTAFVLDLRLHWLGKHTIFKFPFGPVMRWLGGIAVHRHQNNNLVANSAQALRDFQGKVQLIIPPEGTRDKVTTWKTGFYWIAHGAGVPIQLAYMDYAHKRVGLGPLLQPSGDIEADMVTIKAFYAPFMGKHAHKT